VGYFPPQIKKKRKLGLVEKIGRPKAFSMHKKKGTSEDWTAKCEQKKTKKYPLERIGTGARAISVGVNPLGVSVPKEKRNGKNTGQQKYHQPHNEGGTKAWRTR